ncbi:hypothetical protein HN51_014391 [Arachis hypogaea]|uniref:B3 domain-containing protein Os03g0120900 n=2 Tax=Arachis TaxID=3817 RepID=A0A6P5M9J0_ARADU|nr:B3 domain-containing protein Os03g0120900 [Arachis duranensis]XP_015968293.1 B3 domain-containing protein Os03g0120900 [Arachis duranensis]XP_020981802.1 B3 domain-containing protein Os03g0120900 [Arachis duranensis]XP_025603292.1 B3 domain-containing protein Os03g0120900 [Arachis hypogaea]XP_025603293.1 B3 domain-containing protein Os03g0120900 [Arachis hypogaea]XP_052118569.1 B3 domain-containing protein Os03g0120900 [Arachis duranensis]QHO45748.1 B3 domain-containing transcription facto
MEEEVKGYSDSREEEEEEEEDEAAEIIPIPNTRQETNSSGNRLQQQQDTAVAPNFSQRKQLDLMELSLGSGSSKDDRNWQQGGGGGGGMVGSCSSSSSEAVEKEHMFDKVVTPSDVGKLNRLVIPKQHAEKYFPLDSSSNDKGLLLNFEDRNGKLWRFRYSYWNSSQSYVMTKGWSRFVKEKKLDAGDIVSFHRGLGELYRHRLYIDWRRRPDHPPPDPSASLISPFFLPNHYSAAITWGAGGRFYSLPSPTPPPRHHHFHHHQHHPLATNYNTHMYGFHHHPGAAATGTSHHLLSGYNDQQLNSGSPGPLYYLRSPPSMSIVDPNLHQERGTAIAPMIIDSVPVAHHHHQQQQHQHGVVPNSSNFDSTNTAGKRLRLFGVNMECASSSSSSPAEDHSHLAMSSSLPSSSRFGDQRGDTTTTTTSVLFDLDPSLQYHHHHRH